MQTTGSPRHPSGRPVRPGIDRHMSNRRSRWRRDLLSVRAAMPHSIGLVLGASVVCLLSLAASGLANYWRNLAQNTAADLIGAIVAMYVLIPITQRPPPGTSHKLPDDSAAVKEAHAKLPSHIEASTPSTPPDTVDGPANTAA